MSRTRSFIHTSNYRSNAVSVIDTKWWIKWPDDSQRQNQSVSQHATLGRQRHIHLLMILDLFTDHWALDPPGKMCSFAVERRTGACCMQMTVEPIKVPEVRFSVWVWFFWKPDRGASTDLYLSPSSSLNTLRRDCFRFYLFFLNQSRIVAFTWSHLFSEFSEREEEQMVSEQCETHHSPW